MRVFVALISSRRVGRVSSPQSANVSAPRRLPHHLHPGLILLVGLGGAIGTGARYGLELLFPAPDGLPVGTAVANVAGAFALGVLLELLARPVPESLGQRVVRLALGTGVLGGFTTYSALALETWDLLGRQPALAVGYGLGSVLLGLVACFAGVVLSARISRRRAALLPRDLDADELQAASRPKGRAS